MNYNKIILSLVFISFHSFAMDIHHAMPREIQVRNVNGSFADERRELSPITVQASTDSLFSLTCVPVQGNSDSFDNNFSRSQGAKIAPLIVANRVVHEQAPVWVSSRVHPLIVESHEVTSQMDLRGHKTVQPYHDSFYNLVVQQDNLCCQCFEEE